MVEFYEAVRLGKLPSGTAGVLSVASGRYLQTCVSCWSEYQVLEGFKEGDFFRMMHAFMARSLLAIPRPVFLIPRHGQPLAVLSHAWSCPAVCRHRMQPTRHCFFTSLNDPDECAIISGSDLLAQV